MTALDARNCSVIHTTTSLPALWQQRSGSVTLFEGPPARSVPRNLVRSGLPAYSQHLMPALSALHALLHQQAGGWEEPQLLLAFHDTLPSACVVRMRTHGSVHRADRVVLTSPAL